MGKLKKIIKDNLAEFVQFVFEKKLDKNDILILHEFLVEKKSRYSILRTWSRQYGKEFENKKKMVNMVLSDYCAEPFKAQTTI